MRFPHIIMNPGFQMILQLKHAITHIQRHAHENIHHQVCLISNKHESISGLIGI